MSNVVSLPARPPARPSVVPRGAMGFYRTLMRELPAPAAPRAKPAQESRPSHAFA
jgi:hypothetical protein